jgi:hypothetical protein
VPYMKDKDPLEGATENERKGVEAIQYLLGMDAKTEPVEVSLNNWRDLNPIERSITMWVYSLAKRREDK